MEELDRVFDRDDVDPAVLVDVVDHRGQGGGLARAGDAGDQHQPAGPQRDLLQHGRQVELPHGLHLIGNGAEGKGQGAALLVDVGPEAAHAGHPDGEVRLFLLGELLHLPRRHDLLRQQLQILRLDRGHLQTLQLAVEPDGGRPADLEQQVGRVPLDHLGDGLLEIEGRLRGRRLWPQPLGSTRKRT